MKIVKVTVYDIMQQGYTYERVREAGSDFHPDFTPDLTPAQMLKMGIFGGRYMTDCREEFPAEWFRGVRLNSTFHDPELNFFKVNASEPLVKWQQKGWIYPDDPRGWFQWYCRYFSGRRSPDDLRQIARWRAMKRHLVQLRKNALFPGDLNFRRRQRQALLHWAYDTRMF